MASNVKPLLFLGAGALLFFLASSDDAEAKDGGGGGGKGKPPPNGDYPFSHCLDDDMPPAMRNQITTVLESVTDAEELRAASEMAASSGFPKAAACLAAKADNLNKGGPGTVPEPEAPELQPMPFKVRMGDTPYYLALYYTGNGARLHELESVNDNLGPWVTRGQERDMSGGLSGGYQIYENWAPGLVIKLPLTWTPWQKAIPKPASTSSSGKMPTPNVGANF